MTQQPENQPEVKILATPAIQRVDKPPIRGRAKPANRAARRKNVEDFVDSTADPSVPEDDAVSMEDAEIGSATDEAQRASFGGTQTQASGIIQRPDRKVPPGDARDKPPSVEEWQDFIGRVVLRTLTEGYLTLMLRDCDLTPQEMKYLELSKEDLREMSAPFAGFANKNKTLRKHGRAIVSAADSWEALVALSIWMRRVHKVAQRHRPEIQAANAEKHAMKRARNQQRVAHSHVAQSPVPSSTPQRDGSVNPNGHPQPNEGNGQSSLGTEHQSIRPRIPNPGFVDNGGTG